MRACVRVRACVRACVRVCVCVCLCQTLHVGTFSLLLYVSESGRTVERLVCSLNYVSSIKNTKAAFNAVMRCITL